MIPLEALRAAPHGLTIRELNQRCPMDRRTLIDILNNLVDRGLVERVRICDRWRVTDEGRLAVIVEPPAPEPEKKAARPRRYGLVSEVIVEVLRQAGPATTKQITTRVNLRRRATLRSVQIATNALVEQGVLYSEPRLMSSRQGLRSVQFFDLKENR